MKLCATVFAFHHRRIAISGMDGTTARAHACAMDSATKMPSLAHTRGTAIGRARTAVVVSFINRLLRAGSLLQREDEPVVGAEIHVIGPHLRDAVVNRVDVRIARGLGGVDRKSVV